MEENQKSKERVKKYRKAIASNFNSSNQNRALPNEHTAFGSRQSLGTALKRAASSLPRSPREKAAVVKLSDTYVHQIHKEKQCMLSEVDLIVEQFSQSDTVSR